MPYLAMFRNNVFNSLVCPWMGDLVVDQSTDRQIVYYKCHKWIKASNIEWMS